MAASRGSLATSRFENMVIEVSADGGATWMRIPGATSYGETGTTAPATDIVSADNDSSAAIGKARTAEVAFPCYAIPHDPAISTLRNDLYDPADPRLQFRMTTQGRTLLPMTTGTNYVSITTAGAVTFSGLVPTVAGNSLGRGAIIRTANGDFPIYDIDRATDAITVNPTPMADITDDNYRIVAPSWRRGPFAAGVLSADEMEVATEGEFMMNISIKCFDTLPEPVIVDIP